ncbi:MAG: glycine--tRNA ligase subunit beta [Acidobacteria bacterium]|nr:glycine--tRNA ligase subunit beta [Acidobacteriota bacterium]
MAKEFLLEIGCEEIPHWMIPDALGALADRLRSVLAEALLPPGECRTFATPRRLVVCLPELPERQPDRVDEVSGPPAAVGVDAGGNFTKAALGFAARQGASAGDLVLLDTPKGRYVGLRKTLAGRDAAEILAEALPGVIRGIPFPKNMVWKDPSFTFVRPLRNLLALLGGRVVPFELAGVKAGDTTFGHRFLGGGAIPVSGFEDYRAKLEANGVMVDPEDRRGKIRREIAAIEAETGLGTIPDDDLLNQVVSLNEWPTVVAGAFDERFLALPREVLVTVMRKHQKYFSLADGGGNLAARFMAVINTHGDPEGMIRAGHERVLHARLNDAEFFWDTDRRRPLDQRVPTLANVLFQEALGSYFEKVERLESLAPVVARACGLDGEGAGHATLAARLCKADLTTEMVKELTELQGVMGGLYAREEKLPEGVWKAMYEHYRPEGPEDSIPASPEGAVLSLADKMDTVTGMLGMGFVPSGSRDPFGLRRQASGICRIVVERGLDVDLEPLFRAASELLKARITASWEQLGPVVAEFLGARVQHLFQTMGFGYDEINAVSAFSAWRPADARRRLDALVKIRGQERFAGLFTARKRVANILSKQAGRVAGDPDPARFADEAERRLHAVFTELAGPFSAAVAERRYPDALALVERFAEPVDDFFVKVLVMHEDEAVRTNRLRLLKKIADLFDGLCDFSALVMEGK